MGEDVGIYDVKRIHNNRGNYRIVAIAAVKVTVDLGLLGRDMACIAAGTV